MPDGSGDDEDVHAGVQNRRLHLQCASVGHRTTAPSGNYQRTDFVHLNAHRASDALRGEPPYGLSLRFFELLSRSI
jgi:hypothetical protein